MMLMLAVIPLALVADLLLLLLRLLVADDRFGCDPRPKKARVSYVLQDEQLMTSQSVR